MKLFKLALFCEIALVFLFSAWAQNANAHQYEYQAEIISVYDGDTVTAQIDLGFHVSIVEKLRLARINAPEVRGKERPKGVISRDELRKKILNKAVIIHTIKDRKGKYGRYLADIILNGKNINDWLVNSGLAEYKEY